MTCVLIDQWFVSLFKRTEHAQESYVQWMLYVWQRRTAPKAVNVKQVLPEMDSIVEVSKLASFSLDTVY